MLRGFFFFFGYGRCIRIFGRRDGYTMSFRFQGWYKIRLHVIIRFISFLKVYTYEVSMLGESVTKS